jgi:hypothetical protein
MKNAGWEPALRNGRDIPAAARNLRYRAPKNKKPRPKSGRTFLRESFYYNGNAAVKPKVSKSTDFCKPSRGKEIRQ